MTKGDSMKSNNIITLIKKHDIVVPGILISFKKKLNINEKELLFLSYLMSFEDFIAFDINVFCDKLSYDLNDVMEVITSLEEKKILEIVTRKENNILKEYISLNNLYNFLTCFIIEEEVEVEEEKSYLIFEQIEAEFGRPLSPIEFETIKSWLDSNVDEELIKEALKEAVLNNVYNLKYMQKILYEWDKKGYKKATDVRRTSKYVEDNIEVADFNWLEDNE